MTESGRGFGTNLKGLLFIAVIFAAFFGWVWLGSSFSPSWCVVYTGIGLAALLLTLNIWFALYNRVRWQLRLGTIAAEIVLIAALGTYFRIEGVSGDMVPIISRRFAKKPHERLEALPTSQPNHPAKADPGETAEGDTEEHVQEVAAEKPAWPQFFGPDRNGRVPDLQLETNWKQHPPREVWRKKIGAGWSSFAIAGDLAVTQEQRGEQELVTCYRLSTGELVWSHADKMLFESVIAGAGPRATPTIDAGRVYTVGARGLANCLDLQTGEVYWGMRLYTKFQGERPQWGYSCAPLVVDDKVILPIGGIDGALVALDKKTGKEIWMGGDHEASYSSPVLMEIDGTRQIVYVDDFDLAGYDPADGTELWKLPWGEGRTIVSLPQQIGPQQIFVSAGYTIGCRVATVKQNDGKWSAEWTARSRDLKTKFTNAVLKGDYFYGLDEGILAAVHVPDCQRAWKAGRYGHGQVLLVGDLLLMLTDGGDLALIEVSPEGHKELARKHVFDEKTWNVPSMSGRLVLMRTDREMVCWELPVAE